jgi:hypothetical protein
MRTGQVVMHSRRQKKIPTDLGDRSRWNENERRRSIKSHHDHRIRLRVFELFARNIDLLVIVKRVGSLRVSDFGNLLAHQSKTKPKRRAITTDQFQRIVILIVTLRIEIKSTAIERECTPQ